MLQSLLSRKIYFSAAHRYENPQWTQQKNQEVFGSCFSKYGHGHNYTLEATVTGPVHAETGMIINLADLDALLKAVVTPLDHRFLNQDIPYFSERIPTTETIAFYCYQDLQKRLQAYPDLTLQRVRLYENEDLWSEVGL